MSRSKEEDREKNRRLCERYPFLIPRNRFSGMRITEAGNGGFWPGNPEAIPPYDYQYTELDDMPDGWRIAFGIQMLEELREELIRHDCLDKYMIVQIKEKYGFMHWYDSGNTEHGREIIEKYADMSKRICIDCGKPARFISTGWIRPLCGECAEMISGMVVHIDVWVDDMEDDED